MYFIYILLCRDGSLYTGITNDLEKRLERHKSGLGARYTRSKGVVRIVYSEQTRSRGLALVREAEIKKLSRRKKLSLVQSLES